MENTFDVTIKFTPQLASTIDFFTPNSEAAAKWFDENVESDSWQWIGNSLAVEQRYAQDLAHGLLDAGLTLQESITEKRLGVDDEGRITWYTD